ncbi:hypothetical protein [Horticoccus sp. 23ND18S-11]|uniref:hypothetical protein n=1 Tax=Horticoccus sp. 23ND18S-11 TaxID=3391832 RepID=UPI0039C9313A
MKPRVPAADPLAAFPPALRELVAAEVAAGNAVVEISSTFPAPPAGACVRLAGRVTTRPRASAPGLSFYERNSSQYSGEWTDAKRFYWVIEPPLPPPPEPDMDAIRAAHTPSDDMTLVNRRPFEFGPGAAALAGGAPGSVLRRFRDSMAIDYEKWHDGIGYDLSVLPEADAADRETIESILVGRADRDWRDVEALAALNTPGGNAALRAAFTRGNAEIRGAVLRYAPELVAEDEKLTSIVAALRTADFYGGLTAALDEVEEFHPPGIIAELFRGALTRTDGVPVHFAAMLMFLHGKASEPFDWGQRPFFLRFNTQDRAEREAVFRELCEKVGVDPLPYLAARDA